MNHLWSDAPNFEIPFFLWVKSSFKGGNVLATLMKSHSGREGNETGDLMHFGHSWKIPYLSSVFAGHTWTVNFLIHASTQFHSLSRTMTLLPGSWELQAVSREVGDLPRFVDLHQANWRCTKFPLHSAAWPREESIKVQTSRDISRASLYSLVFRIMTCNDPCTIEIVLGTPLLKTS